MSGKRLMEPGEIIIKDTEILIGLMERRFSPLLVQIISSVARKYGIVMTESYRKKLHRTDLHGTQPVRAIDLRSWCYTDSQAQEINHEINRKWEYDPDRPDKKCAIIHRTGTGAIHFHIQVHPHTRRRAI